MWQGSYARAHPVAVHHDTLGGDRPGGAARWTAGLTSPVAFPHLPVPPLGLARGARAAWRRADERRPLVGL